MRAVYFEQPGPPEVLRLGELPQPQPGRGQALVRVTYSAINPIDTYIRAGTVAMPLPRPFIPGCDLAGEVVALGPDCQHVRVGQRVWASNQGLLGRQGTLAEFAVVDECWLHSIPPTITDDQAAGGALVGITAHLGLFQWARLRAEEWVYVSGGTGGVGSMVVQMAKAVGAKVVTTAGSDAKAQLARELAADAVVNYKTDHLLQRLTEVTGGQGINVWYETQREQDFQTIIPAMARRGRIIVMAGRQSQPVLPIGPFYTKDLSLFGFVMFNATPEEQRICAEEMNRWYAAKQLRVLIGKVFPLEAAAAAHAFQEANTLGKAGTLTGKIVVQVAS